MAPKVRTEPGYTLEELMSETGYSSGMIYNLTHFGVVASPIRGLDKALYGSKGLYPEIALAQLRQYDELKRQGLSRNEIIIRMKTVTEEPEHVSLHEGGREGSLAAN